MSLDNENIPPKNHDSSTEEVDEELQVTYVADSDTRYDNSKFRNDEVKFRNKAKKELYGVKSNYKERKKQFKENDSQIIEEAITQLEDALKTYDASISPAYNHFKKIAKKYRISTKSRTREVVESLLVAVAFAVVLRTFIVEPYKIPTRSMVPTLLEGDQLFVTKLSYGIRLPLFNDYVVHFSKPQRGDVIVFAFPNAEAATYLKRTNSGCMQLESLNEEKDYIKRIIGVEGDTIEVIDQKIHVNGEPVSQQPFYERTVSDYLYLSDSRREFWNRETQNEVSYTAITHQLPSNQFGPIKVQPGHVVVMGDNRDNSADSRCWGQVPVSNIKGRAQIIWWSSGHFAPRWERMFTKIY